jgi:ATP-dependent DNA helicase DinG
VNRPYGEVFLNSLPNMKRSRDVVNAGLFLKDLHRSDI